MIEDIAKEYLALLPILFESFRELNNESVELTHLQNHIIEYMYMQNKPLNLKEISCGLNIAKQQLTNIVKDLETGGYLNKVTDTKDKRAVLISLTAKGREIEEKKWSQIYHKFSGNIAKLTMEEQIDLQFALHKVNTLLKKMEHQI